MNRSAQ